MGIWNFLFGKKSDPLDERIEQVGYMLGWDEEQTKKHVEEGLKAGMSKQAIFDKMWTEQNDRARDAASRP